MLKARTLGSIEKSSDDTRFSRSLLAATHHDVKKVLPEVNTRKAAWVHSGGGGRWEFQTVPKHGVKEFMWYGQASNAYHARANGWSAYLDKYHPSLEKVSDAFGGDDLEFSESEAHKDRWRVEYAGKLEGEIHKDGQGYHLSLPGKAMQHYPTLASAKAGAGRRFNVVLPDEEHVLRKALDILSA